MKKIFYLIVGFILLSSLNVSAVHCTDNLVYVTTKDTIAYTTGITKYNLKKGTEFKMCFQAGSEAIVELNDGNYASYVEEGSYILKEKFDMKKAHKIDKQLEIEIEAWPDVFSDPSGITKIGKLPKGTKINATYYFGPYYYFSNSSITGWVYNEISLDDDTDEEETIEEEITEEDDSIDDVDAYYEDDPNSNNQEEDNTKWIIIGIVSFSILLISLITLIIIYIKIKRKEKLES